VIFHETVLPGAFVIDVERIEDERGFFARSWCAHEFDAHGLETRLVQCNVSYNRLRGTLRGMHYQIGVSSEVKLVRCTRGGVYDVIVDLRPHSSTYKHFCGVSLTAENRRMLYIPKHFAHGFLTLTDGAEVQYQMSEFYAPNYARGFRWNDPAFNIVWPEPVRVISEKDRTYSDYSE